MPTRQRLVRMSKVTVFTPSLLRSEETLGFCVEIADKVKAVDCVLQSAPVKAYLAAISAYAGALDTEKQLSYQDLLAADAEVDRIITNLRMHLQVLVNYPVDEVRDSAQIVWDAIDQYGSPTQLSFSEEYAVVIRMLETLEALDKDILTKATVAAWIPALREKYDAFMAMMKAYDNERASIVPGTIKAARQALIDSWRPLCDYINSLAIISPSDELEALIGEMNARIQSKKTALKARKSGKRDSVATDVAVDA